MTGLWGIQLIGVLFGLFMVYLTFLHLRRREFTTKETFFWIGAWLILIFLSIFPMGLDFLIKNWLSFSRRLDFFIVLGFIFLIGIMFYIYSLIRKLQDKVEKIVRRLANEGKK